MRVYIKHLDLELKPGYKNSTNYKWVISGKHLKINKELLCEQQGIVDGRSCKTL
mgnify:CR=1 FL=1